MRNFIIGILISLIFVYFYDIYKTKEMVGLYDNTDYELVRFKHFAYNMKMCMEYENFLIAKHGTDKYYCKVVTD